MPLALALWCLVALAGVSASAIVLLTIAPRKSPHATRLVYGATCIVAVMLATAALAHLVAMPGEVTREVLPLGLPWIGARFKLDALSSFFLFTIDTGAAIASIYAIGYGAHEKAPARVLPFFPAFVAGMNCVVLADDAFSFLVAWEFMSLASWAMVLADHENADNRRAAYVYILMASFGASMLLLAFGVLGGASGAYDFASIARAQPTAAAATLVLILALLGAGSKAGLAPLHVWLPLAHPAAPSHVSALMSAVMTKVAVYAFIRIVFDLVGAPAIWWGAAVMILGAGSAVLGVLFAAVERDLKRLLAYSTIENIGVVFAGLGLALVFKANGFAPAAAVAFIAALLHVFNHSLFKSLLFFGAGAVLGATGQRDIEQLGGLIHRMPKSSFAMLGACMAISALPPLNGFVSEWLLFQAVLVSPILPQWGLKLATPAVGAALALSAALCAAAFVRMFGIVYLGRPRSEAAASARETDSWSLAAMFLLLALCLVMGVAPGYLIDALAPVAHALVGGRMPDQSAFAFLTISPIVESRSSYNGMLVFGFITVSTLVAIQIIHRFGSDIVRRGPAWDCGFPDSNPITQYSASSFAQPIRRVFANVAFGVREKVDMPAPGDLRAARMDIEIEDRIWTRAYAPLGQTVSWIATTINRLQQLTIRGYLSLVFGMLVLLLVWVAAWR
ncbi:MAG: hydrogenase 4 subunit B [Rhodoblastus sp.]